MVGAGTVRLARGARVKAVREESGLDQGAFAVRMSETAAQLGSLQRYDQSKLSKIENGRQDVSLDDAVVILALDTKGRSLAWLALGIESATRAPAKPSSGGQGPPKPPTVHLPPPNAKPGRRA